jgi:hypothetical protein
LDFGGFGDGSGGFDIGIGGGFFPIGGGGGGGGPVIGDPGGGGGISIGLPPIGGTGGGGTSTSVSASSGGLFGLLPAINWGRIAAFLLGLILIAFGLYMIKGVNQAVNVVVKNGARKLAESGEVVAA